MNILGRLSEPFRPRLVPSFLIVGAQKAGTSALFKMLAQHPKLVAPKVKELDFFTDPARVAEGPATYAKCFPVKPLRGDGFSTFEASPAYMFEPVIAERIHSWFPHMHIVAVLRDPVPRAFSAWNMFRQFEHHPKYSALYDPRGFQQALEEELSGAAVPFAHRYIGHGNYAAQLRPFISLFGRSHVHVINYKELKRDPGAQLQHLCSAVGLPPFIGALPTGVKANKRPYAHSMSAEVAQQLRNYFAPQLVELNELLGEPIDLLEPTGS